MSSADTVAGTSSSLSAISSSVGSELAEEKPARCKARGALRLSASSPEISGSSKVDLHSNHASRVTAAHWMYNLRSARCWIGRASASLEPHAREEHASNLVALWPDSPCSERPSVRCRRGPHTVAMTECLRQDSRRRHGLPRCKRRGDRGRDKARCPLIRSKTECKGLLSQPPAMDSGSSNGAGLWSKA